MEVIPGIHQLKVPIPDNPLGHLNAYLIRGDDGWLLVDTGWNTPEALDSLAEQIKEIGLDFSDIYLIVVTHMHPDHYGLAGKVRELSQAKLALHRIENGLIESSTIDSINREMERWMRANGVPEEELKKFREAFSARRKAFAFARPDIALEGGERIPTGAFDFEVMWTPGHSPGHVCLYERAKKILLAGDHILPTITPNISLHLQSWGNPLSDYVHSLKAMEHLEVDLILPSHEYLFQGLQKRIEEILEHHEERKSTIVDIIQGEMTAYEIAPRIPWETMNAGWEGLPLFDRRSAVAEVLAHLEVLCEESRVERVFRDGIIIYCNA